MDSTHQSNCITWRYPAWPCSCKTAEPASPQQPSTSQQSAISPMTISIILGIIGLLIAPGILITVLIPLVFLGVILYGLIVMIKDGDLKD